MAVATSQSASSIRLNPAWTQTLRWLWIVFFILTVILATKGYTDYFRELQTICDGADCSSTSISSEEALEFDEVGLSLESVAIISFILLIPLPAAMLFISVFIMVKRPSELVAVILAFWLLSFLVAGPSLDMILSAETFWRFLPLPVTIVGEIAFFAFLLTFPNGRFVPKWTRWLFFVLVPVIVLIESELIFRVIFQFTGLYIGIRSTLIAGIIGVISQIYRYLRVSTRQERQQTKWIIAAFAIFILFVLLATFVLGSLAHGPYGRIALQVIASTMVITLPLSLLVAIQRYGLWDIDFYINRGIVYISLTALLIAVFAGIFFALETVFNVIVGSGQLGLELIIPTAVVVGLFNPARKRLRHFVDSRFYGIKMDYTRIIESRQKLLEEVDTATTIGQYRTTTLLGSGGMGEVYAGQDTQGQRVAIKVLLTQFEQHDEMSKRFLREAQATAQLKHPHIVKILDVGEDKGRMFIAMEYVEGDDWGSLLKANGALSLEQVVPRLQEIASALDYVHQNGIIHRDIKPSNVMIEAESNRAVLMDFGIAKIATELTAITGTSQIVGSLDYISPEQIQGQAHIDYRTDIYSFGVMTYQLLAGELPFKKGNAGALVMAHLVQPPPDICALKPAIPESVSEAIQQAMAKQPEKRFESLNDFVGAMQV